MTTEDVSNYLKVDVVTVRRLVSRGELAAYRVGSEYRFTQADVREFLQRQRVPAPVVDRVRHVAAFAPFDQMVRGLSLSIWSNKARSKGPFESWTKRAKQALAYAQEEASELQHPYIGTEHILLGLLRDPESIASNVLAELGAHLEEARSAVEFQVGRGEERHPREALELTGAAKQVLERAMAEARHLSHNYIGTEHLLLGVVNGSDEVAFRVLEILGISTDQIRTAVNQALKCK
jgi:excisionase family DNA binding protein